MRFYSRKGLFLGIIIWGTMAFMVCSFLFQYSGQKGVAGYIVGILINGLLLAFFSLHWFGIYYEIGEEFLTGMIFWNHLHIDYLWVDNSLKGKGYGKKLLNHIEKTASEYNCRLILLDSFSFQTPDFYQKFGYKVVGIVEDHPKGFKQYYLEKKLI
jgi:ribosomal protein S18 acetylase RimI-like enzyme